MQAKRNQLRAELRGHLAKVLRERGIETKQAEVTSWPSNSSASSHNKRVQNGNIRSDVSQAIRFQNEENARRARDDTEAMNNDEPVWYERRSASQPRSFSILSPEEQRRVLLQQMEEARQRREAEARRQQECDAMLEDWARQQGPLSSIGYASSSSPTPRYPQRTDWVVELHNNQRQVAALERELESVARQLHALKDRQLQILSFVNGSPVTTSEAGDTMEGPIAPLPPLERRPPNLAAFGKAAGGFASTSSTPTTFSSALPTPIVSKIKQAVDSNKNETLSETKSVSSDATGSTESQPLKVIGKYYVYVAKPKDDLSASPSPISEPEQVPSPSKQPARRQMTNRAPAVDDEIVRVSRSDEEGRIPHPVHDDGSVSVDDDSDDDDSDDDDDDNDVNHTSRAALTALRRAAESSGDESGGPKRSQMKLTSINSYLDAEMPYDYRGTPNSKRSANSFEH